jgi:raffinose/stachyose/melibiose transport system permease protein
MAFREATEAEPPVRQEVGAPGPVTATSSARTVSDRPGGRSSVGRIRRFRNDWPLLALVAPALILLGLFYVLPNILNFGYALTDWTSFKTQINFVGLDNFADLAADGILGDVILTTLKFAIVVTIVQNFIALLLALALERPTRMNLVLRSLLFLPVLLSTLSAGYVARAMLQTDGVVNAGLSFLVGVFGAPTIDFPWLGSTDWTIVVLALVSGWKTGGILMLIYIAGLKAIPGDLVEASRIDGASTLQAIRRIKLPLLAPAFTFNIALTLIGALGAFDIVLAMTSGGPARTTEVFNYVVFKQFGAGFLGYSTAISLVLTIAIVLIAIPIIVLLRRREVRL